MTNNEIHRAFFGCDMPPLPVELRGWRVKASAGGYWVACHPQATGPNILTVQQVPVTVGLGELLRQLQTVTVLRPVSRDYGCRVIHFEEIEPGAILR